MIYVKRDDVGRVIALSAVPPAQVGADSSGWQQIAPDHPLCQALGAFFNAPGSGSGLESSCTAEQVTNDIGATDAGLIRVLEDLIDVLVERGVIRFTDLPEAAQNKLTARQSRRAELRKLTLLDDEHDCI